jgi:hypothetical protein
MPTVSCSVAVGTTAAGPSARRCAALARWLFDADAVWSSHSSHVSPLRPVCPRPSRASSTRRPSPSRHDLQHALSFLATTRRLLTHSFDALAAAVSVALYH